MRSVQIEASTHHQFAVPPGLCPLLSPCRHCRDVLLLHTRPRASSFLPPFPQSGFASRPFRRSQRPRYYEGSDSCQPHPDRQVSPLTPPCRPDIPSSTTRAALWSLCQSPQRQRLLPGFATNEQARHSFPPKQVRHPTDCRFTSGCSPPRLAATQLPSITGACDQLPHGLAPCRQSVLTDALMTGLVWGFSCQADCERWQFLFRSECWSRSSLRSPCWATPLVRPVGLQARIRWNHLFRTMLPHSRGRRGLEGRDQS